METKPVHSKQWFKDVDTIYKQRFNAFISLARKHIYNRDLAIDAVHDAIAKAVAYFNKNPHRKVREQVINFLILRACKKYNKYSNEVPYATDSNGYLDLAESKNQYNS